MPLAEYARAIRFRWLGPDSRLPPRRWVGAVRRLRRLGIDPEEAITRLPEETPDRVLRGLRELRSVPRMSTLAVGAIVARGVQAMPPGSAYLNVGLWHGYSLLAGMVGGPDRPCVGVDDFSEFGGPAEEFRARFEARAGKTHRFHAMDYREYFERRHREPVGMYFWDGPRGHEDELRGLKLVEPHLVAGGHILVDDVNWDDRRRAAHEFVTGSGGAIEVVFDRRTAYNKHLTFWNGVMILRKVR